jgi:hypothetical protein
MLQELPRQLKTYLALQVASFVQELDQLVLTFRQDLEGQGTLATIGNGIDIQFLAFRIKAVT